MPHTRRLFYQSHILHSPSVLRARRNDVQPCGVDAAVTEHIGELRDILIHFIEHPRKQMSEIVREHLIRAYASVGTDRFHIPPDICPINGKPAPRNKYHTALYPMLFCIIKQPIPQFRNQENNPRLALAAYNSLPAPSRFYGDETQLTDAHSRASDCLQYQSESCAPALRSTTQAIILLPRQLRFLCAVQLPLNSNALYMQLVPAEMRKQTAE